MTAAENSDRPHASPRRAGLPWEGEGVLRHWLFPMVLLGLGALYLLQTLSPLRLDSDAVDYLSTAAAMADGRALPTVPFPPGYPVIIALLDRTGLGSTFFFILANSLFLGLGVWATWRIFGDRAIQVRMWIVVATLLLVQVVRSVAAPLPEAAFFGASLLSLAAASTALSANGLKRLMLFGLSFALAGLAVSVRLVGLALIPALLWGCLSAVHDVRPAWRWRQLPAAATISLVVVLAAVVLILSRTAAFTHYMVHPRFWYVRGGLSSPVVDRLYGMLTGFGELIINLPLSRFHALQPVFAAAGLVALVALMLARQKPSRLDLAGVYLIFYLAILALWPYDSPRLWMPIAPLIVAHVVSTLARAPKSRAVRLFVPVYAAWVALTGIVALAYTSRISLSGGNFGRLYGTDGGMATAALHTLGPAEKQKYNARADSILSRYGGGRANRVYNAQSRP
ncbi:MAG TPA: hypothetical protein VES88_05155 [Gemmatimonadaceae bacterium]|nr:hypothetical protein [Gemmatimonadaceae bacterium]